MEDETFKARRIKFIILQKGMLEGDDKEWEVPDQKMLEKVVVLNLFCLRWNDLKKKIKLQVMSLAIAEFTADDPDLLDVLEYSSLG